MLYYTSLFLVIVLFSVIAIWMYRGIIGVGRATYNAMLPGRSKATRRAKARLKARQKRNSKTQTTYVNGSVVPTPWGWKDTEHTHHSARTVRKPGSEKVLWSGPSSRPLSVNEPVSSGSDNSAFSGNAANKPAGWPYRQDKLAVAGKAYKVNRKPSIDGDGKGKHWVW
jgi:hypothetical protein